MNRGLISKMIRESWTVTLLCGLGVMGLEGLLAYVYPTFSKELSDQLLGLEVIQRIVSALVGTDIQGAIGLEILTSIAWVHPLVLALLWVHEITLCTGMLAGEIDRGTVDVLFGLPVSRWNVYISGSLVWSVSGAMIICMGGVGSVLGGLTVPSEARTGLPELFIIISNLFCMYLAVGGLALLVSACCDRRGRAVAIVFAAVLTSFLVYFLGQFSEVAKRLSFVSVLSYYEPLAILRDQAWPVSDMALLVICAATLWLVGGMIFARRDICTV